MAGDKRVLIVGGGGREHALATALKKSPQVGEIFCSPGNAGIASMATCVDINDGVQGLARWAEENRIDLTVVGPEAELAVGIADIFAARGLTLFGPSRAAAALETSKVFAKEFMARHGIPTAAYQVFSDYGQALDYLARQSFPLVIKADGLAAGKGVTVADNLEEAQGALEAMMVEGIFGEAGSQVVIEEFLPGEEATLLVFTDGEQILPMPSAQDHKRIGEGDTGPNTGGMGAYSPTRVLTPSLEEKVMETIVRPTIEGMAREGRPYQGVLYVGLMLNADGPRVVEFNCRFGDPETQVILPRLKSDLYPVLEGCAKGDLGDLELQWDPRSALCVVLASQGYPGDYKVGEPITIGSLDDDIYLFHAGTAYQGGQLVTDGGRVLGVTALGDDLAQAQERAYAACREISFPGCYYRRDIGWRAL